MYTYIHIYIYTYIHSYTYRATFPKLRLRMDTTAMEALQQRILLVAAWLGSGIARCLPKHSLALKLGHVSYIQDCP